MPSSSRDPRDARDPRDSPARRQRRRRTHQRIDSQGDLGPRSGRLLDADEPTSPTKPRQQRRSHRNESNARSEFSKSNSTALSSNQLAQLDTLNQKLGWNEYEQVSRQPNAKDRRATRADYDDDFERDRELERERRRQEHKERKRRRRAEERAAEAAAGTLEERDALVFEKPKRRRAESVTRSRVPKSRVASGQALERGSRAYYSEKETYQEDIRRRDGSSDLDFEEAERKRKRRRKIFIGVAVVLVLLAIIIPVAVVVSKKHSSDHSSSGNATSTTSSTPSNSNLDGISESSIPSYAQGTYLDPFTWYDTTDFNVTFTNATVGGLSIMGLNSTWDDSARPNSNVVALDKAFDYGTTPIRGVNLGGWLSIEPFITPSLFSDYDTSDDVVDEYTLSSKLGATTAKSTIEKHYSSFVSEQTFADIQAAGFDHIRVPFSYWAVTTYDGDPYVPKVSWRYLLRGIEWARKYGLRINLDLHGAPGSQNGWNHSGRQGDIGWLNGTDGTLNGDRTIAIHTQLAEFFSQPRYTNIITMYGLVNEPRMTYLDVDTVITWSETAIAAIRGQNYTGVITFGDGFLGLDNWQGKLQNETNLLLDVHQYVIFNVEQIVLNHHDKINFACGGWTAQMKASEDTSTGFGSTLCGEWSQADTDCATYLNNVGVGSRWEGTLNMVDTPGGSSNGSVLTPTCPTENDPRCQCSPANADPSSYADEYKAWLLMFAEAQMYSFEQGWGWFYWTWQTETATQWSYKDGLAAGIMPSLAYQRDFNCSQTIPAFATLGLPEYY